MKGNILNIERYHYTDGNGIRIMVFMKGCNLRCLWCSNPESQRYTPQLAFNKNKCVNCGPMHHTVYTACYLYGWRQGLYGSQSMQELRTMCECMLQ